MKSMAILAGAACTCLLSSAQVPEVRPQAAGPAVQEGQVTVLYLAPRFATAIRMPDTVNSVMLGDSDSFTAKHLSTPNGSRAGDNCFSSPIIRRRISLQTR
jgi:hypothetical protein